MGCKKAALAAAQIWLDSILDAETELIHAYSLYFLSQHLSERVGCFQGRDSMKRWSVGVQSSKRFAQALQRLADRAQAGELEEPLDPQQGPLYFELYILFIYIYTHVYNIV